MYPPRICFSTSQYPPDRGGIAESACRIANNLSALGFEMHVFARSRDAAQPTYERTAGNRALFVYRVPPGNGSARGFIELADRVTAFDLFHGFFLPAAFPCIRVSQRRRRPLIASIRGVDGISFDSTVIRKVVLAATWLTSVSTDSLCRAQSIVPDIACRSSFIPNGVDFSADTQPWELSGKNAGVVGTIALFRQKKNIPLLLDAYRNLSPQIRKELLLAGAFAQSSNADIVHKQHVERLLNDPRIQSEVCLTGYIEHNQVPAMLRRMRVFVLSSDHEGLPNSIMEAAALGMPIIATAVDGIKDVLHDGVSALLVPPQDSSALSIAIEKILTNDSLAQSLGRGAAAVAKQLSPTAEAHAYAQLYCDFLDRNERWGCVSSRAERNICDYRYPFLSRKG